MIKDRFHFREICDDDRMQLYWNRTLATIRDRYKAILRVETIKFDPLVSKYFEGEFTLNGTNNSSMMKNNINSGIVRRTVTEDEDHEDTTDNDLAVIKDFTHTEGNYTDDIDVISTGNDTRTGNNTTTDIRRGNTTSNNTNTTVNDSTETTTDDALTVDINHHAMKEAPMNASGVGIGTQGDDKGKLINLDFDYASEYDMNDHTGTTHTEGEDKIHGESTSTDVGGTTNNETSNMTHVINEGVDRSDTTYTDGSREYEDDKDRQYNDERDIHNIGNYHKSTVTSDQNTGSNSGSEETTGSNYQIKHDRYTGRDNVLPQDALKAAMNYLQNYSTAFEWLCNKLEINFIGVYDI